MIYRHFYFWFFRQRQYTLDYSQQFDKKYFVGFYASKAYSVILRFLGMLYHIYFEPFPKIPNYKNHNNTYEHIVLLRNYCLYYGNIWNNMKRNVIRITIKYYLGIRIDINKIGIIIIQV